MLIRLLLCVSLAGSVANGQSSWTALSPSVSPSPRGGAAGSSDGTGLVVFGGNTGGGVFSDEAWRFDGQAWTDISPTSGRPAGRDWHGQAFDQSRQRLLVFGGRNGAGQLGDTWEFDGTQWFAVSPPTSPSARHRPAAAFDPIRGRFVIHGGFDGSSLLNDTWEYDGTTWAQISTPNAPSPRQAHKMVFDLVSGLMVMHGGNIGPGRSPETWTYDGTDWTLLPNAAAPFGSGLENYGMAYDLVRRRVVLQGGLSGATNGTYRSKTFDFDGQTWIDRGNWLNQNLTARTGQAMDFVAGLNRTIQFGGFSPGTNFLASTFEWKTATVGQFSTTGAACPGPNGDPTLTAANLPWGGDDLEVLINNLPASATPFLLVGLSNTQWAGGSLPASLSFLGAPNCFLHVSPDVAVGAPVVGGSASVTFGIPDRAPLYGKTFYVQGLILNAGSFFATGRGDALIGGY